MQPQPEIEDPGAPYRACMGCERDRPGVQCPKQGACPPGAWALRVAPFLLPWLFSPSRLQVCGVVLPTSGGGLSW